MHPQHAEQIKNEFQNLIKKRNQHCTWNKLNLSTVNTMLKQVNGLSLR